MPPHVAVHQVSKSFSRHAIGRRRTLRALVAGVAKRSVRHDPILALQGVSFILDSGESLGVIGANGAGKSTLLRLVGGVGYADSGTIETWGRFGALLELGAGGNDDLSGRDNIILGGVIAGLSRMEARRRVDEIVGFAELEDFVDSPLRTYSTGMQMRLSFSIIVHSAPDILLVDEVLQVGDMAFQYKCLSKIRALRDRGCCLLIASHDLAQIADICDRVLWLQDGNQRMLGDPNEVVDAYRQRLSSKTLERTPDPTPVDETTATSDVPKLVLQSDRLGSQELKITNVRIEDADTRETDQFRAGQPFRVVIDYHTEKSLPGAIFGVTISDDRGRSCLDVNSGIPASERKSELRDSTAILEVFSLDLRPGQYFVNVGIYERAWGYAYDYHWHAYKIKVEPKSLELGLRSAPHRWIIEG